MSNQENSLEKEIADSYKHAATDNEEYLERYAETENVEVNSNLFTSELPAIIQRPHERLNELDLFLQGTTDVFSLSEISDLKDIIVDIPPNFISNETIDKILNELPEVASLSLHSNMFEIFSHITSLPSLALIVSRKNFIQSITYKDFEVLSIEMQSNISATIYNLIMADGNNRVVFYRVFFPYFYSYLKSGQAYRSNDLPAHLRLAGLFVDVCNEQEFHDLFNTFYLFSFRTKSDSIEASLHGMCTCLAKQGELVKEIKDSTFLRQLAYLATRKCISEESNAEVAVRQCALVIFEYIGSQTSTMCDKEAYISMFNIIQKNFATDEDNVRSEAIILFGFAIANSFFTNLDNYQELVYSFLPLFDDLTAEVKKDWIRSFANVIYFLPNDFIKTMFENEDFMDRLEESLWFDVPDVQSRLLTAIHHFLFHNPNCLGIITSNEGIIAALENLNENDDLHPKTESILAIIHQAQQQ